MAWCFLLSNRKADRSTGCKPSASEGVLIFFNAASLVKRFTHFPKGGGNYPRETRATALTSKSVPEVFSQLTGEVESLCEIHDSSVTCCVLDNRMVG
jgi:hypothetical protein